MISYISQLPRYLSLVMVREGSRGDIIGVCNAEKASHRSRGRGRGSGRGGGEVNTTSMAAGGRREVLSLYKALLRESEKFTSYNYR